MRQAAARVFEVTDAPVPVAEPDAPADAARRPSRPAGPLGLGPLPRCAGRRPSGAWTSRSPPGRRVAIVGPERGRQVDPGRRCSSASWPVEAGSVSLDGMPLDRLTGDELRAPSSAWSARTPISSTTTIAENLRVGQPPTPPTTNCASVLDRVGLAGWLDGLPRGLATEVGRHGARLSGGQRQRIAVARALLADFPVLVLDEPAEHLDPLAADALTADLLDVTDGRSLVLITHRLAGLESVDEILVMDAGRVVERGTHDELLGRGGRYSDLWWEEMDRGTPQWRPAPESTRAEPHDRQPTAATAAGLETMGAPRHEY